MSATANLDVVRDPFKSWDILPEAQASLRERRWLESRLKRGERERFSETVKVTPGLAALMLTECNSGNRPLLKVQVQLHVGRLQRGEFILTHHGISFSKTRILNDGQHRLHAIVDSNTPGVIEITFGAEREEFLVIDQNRKRSAGDMLAIMGEHSWVLRASVAKMLYQVNKSTNSSPDSQLVTSYALDLRNPHMDDAINMGWNLSSNKVCPPTPVAVAYYWIVTKTKKSRETVDRFWSGLSNGENINGVKLRLRNWLKDEDSKAKGNAQRNCQRSAMIILAWNAFIKGKKTIARDYSKAWPHQIKLPDVE